VVLPIVPAALAWTPNGDALTYVDRKDGVTQLFSRPPGNGVATPVTRFTEQDIFDFAWSRDGRQLALARGKVTTDVVLLSARQ
jgi:Tol biopolymer transport system component